MTTLFIGSSHVKRFSSYLGNRGTSAELFNIYGLPPVRFFGLSGGTVTNPRHLESFLAAVQHHRPKFLVVHLGGNDLDSDEDNTQLVVLKLIAFLQTVKVHFTIHKVTVVKLLPREQTRHVDPVFYNQRVIAANTFLKDQCALTGLVYWRMRGFTNSGTNIFADGVHLNSVGMNKYFRQLRGILLSHTF